ncbi:CMP deaminase domain-containing protein [Fadolivirus algeromassiliense]|jgi:deoxycytidylate deaminase|uniref:CMP deaminase domain-containing protein n=1 Tax=Fadolivirus FV1/VV64 TaxID=3070911 RepID=A0A7D3V8J0_9VIRU|nr:CMP deaminase domain-containing protein [Fadolivirus algeromassiliense]QKF93577.1 CMP deaminase domain-containing protein [Fadolivirus FV1/VV64]
MNKFVLAAHNEALKSPMSKKYGAVLIYNNKIISRGHNYYKYIGPLKENCLLCCY